MPETTPTFLLVLEGLDGSGKSALTSRLYDHFTAALGADHALRTYEPRDDVQCGADIRRVLAKQMQVSARTLALMFAANRSDHADTLIAPFLSTATAATPRIVIMDRYYMSSLVYQARDGLSIDDVMAINSFARTPDLTLFVDADVQVCYDRIGDRGGERQLFETRLNDTRANYMQVIAYLRGRGETIDLVDANGKLDQVVEQTLSTLMRHAPDWLRAAAGQRI